MDGRGYRACISPNSPINYNRAAVPAYTVARREEQERNYGCSCRQMP